VLFHQWCNLKVVFSKHTDHQKQGIINMLQTTRIPHVGHHHRGADDVRNLVTITLWLHEQGASLETTTSI